MQHFQIDSRTCILNIKNFTNILYLFVCWNYIFATTTLFLIKFADVVNCLIKWFLKISCADKNLDFRARASFFGVDPLFPGWSMVPLLERSIGEIDLPGQRLENKKIKATLRQRFSSTTEEKKFSHPEVLFLFSISLKWFSRQ